MITATLNAYPGAHSRRQNVTSLFGTLVFSGSYTTLGDTLTLPPHTGLDTSASHVVQVYITGIVGYQYQYNQVAGKVVIQANDSNNELSAGPYPGDLTGDTVHFEAIIKNT